MSRPTISLFIAPALVAGLAASAQAAPFFQAASSGSRSASVLFDTSGTDLIVTLTNTSALDALVPVDVLGAVFFDIAGSPLSLTRASAVVPAGHVVFNGPTDPGGVVGGEWAYNSGLSGAPFGADYGISSVGLGLFGPGDLFPGTDLQPPTSPDGLQYGITTAGDNPLTGNTPMMTNALIRNQVVFMLSGLPLGFDPSTMISNITFQYGTDLSEPQIRVPAPGALLLAPIGGLLALRRRR